MKEKTICDEAHKRYVVPAVMSKSETQTHNILATYSLMIQNAHMK
jgi:hypothetical protein